MGWAVVTAQPIFLIVTALYKLIGGKEIIYRDVEQTISPYQQMGICALVFAFRGNHTFFMFIMQFMVRLKSKNLLTLKGAQFT